MKRFISALGVASCLILGTGVFVGCSGDRYHRSTGEVIDDAALKTKIKAALINDPEVSGMSIDVAVDKGNVQLNGWGKTPRERQKAEEITWGVGGVKSVKNNIELK